MSESTTVPTSAATNSYDLLDDVCKVITEEPKRLHMNYVCLTGSRLQERAVDSTDYDESSAEAITAIPHCNTVGCIAGWALVLTGHVGPDSEIYDTEGAGILLGLQDDQREELFYPTDLVCDLHPQTAQHAARTVEHIHDFQARNAAQLLAHRIVAHVER